MKNSRDVKYLDDIVITSLDDADKFSIDFISKLVQRRIELGFSQRKLAEVSGVKQSAIARLEMCKSSPQLNTIYKIIKPLRLKLELVSNDEELNKKR